MIAAMNASGGHEQVTRREAVPRLERIGPVRVHAVASFDLIDPLTVFYGLAIAAGAVAGMVVASLRFG
jgi:hypothetical protein